MKELLKKLLLALGILIGLVVALLIFYPRPIVRLVGSLFADCSDLPAYMSIDQWKSKNSPNAQISNLDWSRGKYKIFYKNKQGLFSQMSDGTDKKLLFSNPLNDTISNYFIIDPGKRIVVFTNYAVVLIDEDGSNPKELLRQNGYDFFYYPRLSLDRQKIIFAQNPSQIPNYAKVYLIDLQTEQIQQLDNSNILFNPGKLNMFVDNLYWLKNNEAIIRVIKYVPSPTLSDIIKFNPSTNKAEVISSFRHTNEILDSGKKKKLSTLVDSSQLVIPQPDSYEQYIYESGTTSSPDGSKIFSLKDDDISQRFLINGVEIFKWDRTHKCGWTFRNPRWLPDNQHLLVFSVPEQSLRIVEISTRKDAFLSEGEDAKWFGQKADVVPSDWK